MKGRGIRELERLKPLDDQAVQRVLDPGFALFVQEDLERAKAMMRASLKGTIAGKLTQQDVLNAFGQLTPEQGQVCTVWLQMEDSAGETGPVWELVDYTLSPVGTPDPSQPHSLPLALSRAESGSICPFLPLRDPLWLVGIELDLRRIPGPRLTLIVRRNYGPGSKPAAAAVTARERIQWCTVEMVNLGRMHPGARRGEVEGYHWIWIEQGLSSMPWLCVPAQSQHLEPKWLELYARLLLGEDLEDT